MSAIIDRIIEEEAAKTKKCGCRGCDNMATHTWSGHPTCDSCGDRTPKNGNKQNSTMPFICG